MNPKINIKNKYEVGHLFFNAMKRKVLGFIIKIKVLGD
jgi:hypothetical protein